MTPVNVLIPKRLERAFTYLSEVPLPVGTFVEVPLGRGSALGTVWDAQTAHGNDAIKLKAVTHALDLPPLPQATVAFLSWVAAYTMTPLGLVLKMSLWDDDAQGYVEDKTYCWYLTDTSAKLTTQRLKVASHIAQDPHHPSGAALARACGVSPAVISTMEKAGLLAKEETQIQSQPTPPLPSAQTPVTLSPAQRDAAKRLCDQVEKGAFEVTLLDGVTGSGKTQVYLEAVAKALSLGKQVLILLPEISLTPQTLDRFEKRFGVEAHLWHSGVSLARKRRAWFRSIRGGACVVIGARSALFLPFANLGLIVVDEEHEHAYKQEQGVIYHARDMAVVRAKTEKISLILASATPSLETLVNAGKGRYHHLKLTDRFAGAQLPQIQLVDMREKAHAPPSGQWVSRPMVEKLTQVLEDGKQSLLYLNRRGYAPLTLCRTCGHRMACDDCHSWLVDHKSKKILMCHQCGHTRPRTQDCPACHAEESLVPCGPGAERLLEEVVRSFPQARVAMMTSDHGTLQERHALLEDMEKGSVDILIGTQMIAKGHHFPLLTFVGIVDADLGLSGGDVRASEHTYQLLHQVAGRCGREEHPGEVMIQTFDASHPVLQALACGDRDGFIEAEIAARQDFLMPPFARLVSFIFSSKDEHAVATCARAFVAHAPSHKDVQILGPTPAPLMRLSGQWRWRVLLKTDPSFRVQPYVSAWKARLKLPHSVRLHIDVDPYSFL